MSANSDISNLLNGLRDYATPFAQQFIAGASRATPAEIAAENARNYYRTGSGASDASASIANARSNGGLFGLLFGGPSIANASGSPASAAGVGGVPMLLVAIVAGASVWLLWRAFR